MKTKTKNMQKARKMMFEESVKKNGYDHAVKYYTDPKKQALINAAAIMFIGRMPWEFENE